MAKSLKINNLKEMRELSVQLVIYPITRMSQDVYRLTADPFEFNPVPEDSEAGRCFNCAKEITVDIPPDTILRDFSIGKFAIVEFRDTRYRKFQIGDNKIPAIVSLWPNLNTATLKIECKMLKSPLL